MTEEETKEEKEVEKKEPESDESEEEKPESEEEKPQKDERPAGKAPLLVIVTIIVVIVVGGALLLLSKEDKKEEIVAPVPLTDEQIVKVAYEATESIVLTAERNLEYEVKEQEGTVESRADGYLVSFPISGSSTFSELLISLDSNLNLLQVGYLEDELTHPQVFFKVVSVSNSQLEMCASLFLEQEVLANWINKFNETLPLPGKALIFTVSSHISCENITFPYSVKLEDGMATVTVLYNISTSITFEEGRIDRGVDIPFEDINKGVEIQVGRPLVGNETDKLFYTYRVIPHE